MYDDAFIGIGQRPFVGPVIAGGGLHFRILLLQGRPDRRGHGRPAVDLSLYTGRGAVPYLVQLVRILVKPVITQFIVHPFEDQYRARHSYGQSQYIHKGGDPVPSQVPEGYFQMDSEHRLTVAFVWTFQEYARLT